MYCTYRIVISGRASGGFIQTDSDSETERQSDKGGQVAHRRPGQKHTKPVSRSSS